MSPAAKEERAKHRIFRNSKLSIVPLINARPLTASHLLFLFIIIIIVIVVVVVVVIIIIIIIIIIIFNIMIYSFYGRSIL